MKELLRPNWEAVVGYVVFYAGCSWAGIGLWQSFLMGFGIAIFAGTYARAQR